MKTMFKPRIEFQRTEKLRLTTKPLIPICRALGLVPSNNEFLVTPFWLKYSILTSVTVTFVNILIKGTVDFFRKKSSSDGSNLTSALIDYTPGFAYCACVLSHAVSLWLFRLEFQNLFTGLKELTDVKDRYFFATYALWFSLFKSIPTWVLIFYRNGSLLNRSSIGNVAQEIVSIMFYLVAAQFCLYLELIRHQLKRLVSDMRPNHLLLIPLVKRHYHCIEFASLVNNLFSYQLLIMCSGIFVNQVLSVYDCILRLKNGDFILSVTSALTFIRLVTVLFFLAYSCEETKDKADEFNDTLFKMMRENKQLCTNENLYLYITMKHTLNFSACGFFYVGYPLVTSILAAATTYLVILVQFSST